MRCERVVAVKKMSDDKGGRLPEPFKKKKTSPELHAGRIEDYALIGDLETAALVSRDGSIDWLCWPSFADPACFAALLGTPENGFWRIRPDESTFTSERRYQPDTMILETTFKTEGAEACLTDFMPPRGKHSDVIRIVRGVRGSVKMRMDMVLRFDYGLTVPWVTMHKGELRAVAGPNMVVLRCECVKGGEQAELHGEGLTTVSEFTLEEGHEVCFALTYAAAVEDVPEPVPVKDALRDTKNFWCDWMGKSQYNGPYEEAVNRSLMTLKAMTYAPTGGIVAAITMGLPEKLGGSRNWDYRYCWLRDTAFMLLVLINAGYTEEAVAWRLWLMRAVAGAPDQVQTLYGIRGDRKLLEWDVTWLPGYENSKPVRCGNAASEQFQLDVYGEVSSALNRMPEAEEDIRTPSADLQAELMDHLCKVWKEPDQGIWEVRGECKQFVHSKAMAWLALERAVNHYDRYDGKGDIALWRKTRDEIHKEVCEKGFSTKLNSFTQSYGSESLDASCLRLGLIGFLPIDDPRIVGTIDAIQKKLTVNGFVQRYNTDKTDDGLQGSEGTFLACSFWMVCCLHLIGREQEAREMFERLLTLRNDVGLLSEEYDPKEKRMLGNYPQALSHITLLHAAYTIGGLWKPTS